MQTAADFNCVFMYNRFYFGIFMVGNVDKYKVLQM
jgi:hypothetical protein